MPDATGSGGLKMHTFYDLAAIFLFVVVVKLYVWCQKHCWRDSYNRTDWTDYGNNSDKSRNELME